MRSILCPADSSEAFDCRFETALALARTTSGHLTLQIATPLAQIAAWEPFGGAALSAAAIAQARDDDEKLARSLAARLAHQDVAFDVQQADEGRIDALASSSRLADVTVMSIADPALEEVALTVRCPVLAVPGDKPMADFSGPVVVAWDGGHESANALRAALPLLRLARPVHVVTVREKATDFPPTEALRYLSRHDVHAELHELPREGAISATITGTAHRLGAGLIVMGVFGHSRLRELLLGGVSRELLDHSKVPLLLAH
jgi:nucleotide-binding universal stress UspA family protein